MTYPPNGSAAPPGHPAAPAKPNVPPQQTRGAVHGMPASAPAPAPARRTAWAEGMDRLRSAATTEPGRLRIIGALLALLVVAFGATTSWQMTDRSAAADDVLHSSQPLSADAADIYRSLADANTAASSGFLAGGQEPAAMRDRYEKDIRTAAAKLVTAAASTDPGTSSAKTIAKLNTLLPQYKGLIERARANNRQGFPLGGAYLRYANEKMQTEMLPEAENLYTNENERLRDDYDAATPYPWIAIAVGVLAVAALVWAQRRNYRRTNRVFNHGLLAATAASVVVLLWLVVGHTVARSGLNSSYDGGVRSLNVLHDASIASLKARGNENLTLVSRGAETTTVKGVTKDKYDVDFQKQMNLLADKLTAADKLAADDRAGRTPVTGANDSMKEWLARHTDAREQDDAGNYQGALDKIIGSKQDKPTGECFDLVDQNLDKALAHEQRQFSTDAGDGLDAMTGLPVGAALLAVLAAAGAVLGIGRRLSEYR
ncbi:hypothetical protein ACIREE_32005 [Streptomyces sp. NPDC102467]|uniref:hypothetical protein n=1 Tax=Streptomyces sp. NPDC102467 TaxID=3366179 RepID=UPI0037FC0ACF